MRINIIVIVIATVIMALSRANHDELADKRTLLMHEDEEEGGRDLKGMSDFLKAKQGLLKDIQEQRMGEKRSSRGESDGSASNKEMVEEEGSDMDEEE